MRDRVHFRLPSSAPACDDVAVADLWTRSRAHVNCPSCPANIPAVLAEAAERATADLNRNRTANV